MIRDVLQERSDQQLAIEKAIGQLGRDLTRVVRADRSHRTKLTDLERRVTKLRAQARKDWALYADQEVNEIRREKRDERRLLGLNELFATCARCEQRVIRTQLPGHHLVCVGQKIDEEENDPAVAEPGDPDAAQCRLCLAYVKQAAFEAHEDRCRERHRIANDAKNNGDRKNRVAFPPQAPRHVKVGAVGATSIELTWAPPILDGGATIFEYEVHMSYLKITGRVGKKTLEETVALNPFRTTRYALNKPVCDFGATLTELMGGTEYVDIAVRCLNAVGWSDFGRAAVGATTQAAVPPTAPLCPRAGAVTRTTVALAWSEPLFDGGSPLVDYVVSFVEVRRYTPNEWAAEDKALLSADELKQGANKKDGRHEVRRPRAVRVGGAPKTPTTTLRGLRAGTSYEKIRIVAVSRGFNVGTAPAFEKSDLAEEDRELRSAEAALGETVTTLPPSMRYLIEQELARCRATHGDFVDTDFYTGFLQRESKADYVSRLEADLAETIAAKMDESQVTPPGTPVSTGRASLMTAEAMPVKTKRTSEEGDLLALEGFARQAAQYEVGKRRLLEGIVAAKAEQQACLALRGELTRRMAELQERLLAVQGEIDRVKDVRAQFINSSVMHGASQRFAKAELQKDLQAEQERCFAAIADAKRQVRSLADQRQRAIRAVERKEKEVHDRDARHAKHVIDARRQVAQDREVRRFGGGGRTATPAEAHRVVETAWAAWVDYRGRLHRTRCLLKTALEASTRRQFRAAWDQWRFPGDATHGDTTHRLASLNKACSEARPTKGTVLLAGAARRRDENVADAHGTLRDVSMIRSQLDALTYFTQSQVKKWQQDRPAGFLVSDINAPPGHDENQHSNKNDASLAGKKMKQQRLRSSSSSSSGGVVEPETASLLHGDVLARLGRPEEAVEAYHRSIAELWERGAAEVDVGALSRCYARLGAVLCGMGRGNEGVVSYDRAVRVAEELSGALEDLRRGGTGDSRDAAVRCRAKYGGDLATATAAAQTLVADAQLGLGQALTAVCRYAEAHVTLSRARGAFGQLGDSRRVTQCARALAACCRCEHLAPEVVEKYVNEADEVQFELKLRMKRADAGLAAIHDRMVDASTHAGPVVHLKRESQRALRLRAENAAMEERILELRDQRVDQEKETAKQADLLDRIVAQLAEAKKTDKDEMSSTLVQNGREQIFEIEELKVQLADRLVQVTADVAASRAEERAIDIRSLNCRDTVATNDAELAVETGHLMTSVLEKQPFRFVALNVANTAGNDVLGKGAVGGVPKVAVAVGRTVAVYDLADGRLRRVFDGDEANRHIGAVMGHTALVSCLFYSGDTIFSGGMDRRAFAWDTSEASLAARNNNVLEGHDDDHHHQQQGARGWPVLRLEGGHEASVVAVAADTLKVVTGGADCATVLWARHSGAKLRALTLGHTRSVTALHIGPAWVVTGGADSLVRVWRLPPDSDPSSLGSRTGGNTTKREASEGGHRGARDRALAALAEQRIASPSALDAGGAALTVVRYGALEVLAGLADGSIVVWWLASGAIAQRVAAHRGPVCSLQFDATRVVSAGDDGTVVVTDLTSGLVLRTLRGHEGRVSAVAFDTTRIFSAGCDTTLRQWPWKEGGSRKKKKNNNTAAGGSRDGLLVRPRQDTYHVYAEGDTVAKVAKKYDLGLADLIKWNAIEVMAKVAVGQRLVVAKAFADEPTAAERAADLRAEKRQERAREMADAKAGRDARAEKNNRGLLSRANNQGLRKKTAKERRAVDRSSAATRMAQQIAGFAADEDTQALGRLRETEVKLDATALAARVARSIDSHQVDDDEDEDEDDSSTFFDSEEKNEVRLSREALMALEDILLPSVLNEFAESIANAASHTGRWHETLAGRFRDYIDEGPVDYDALEDLVKAERAKTDQLKRRQQEASVPPAGAAADALFRPDVQDVPSECDSQYDVETVVSASSDGRTVRTALKDAFYFRRRRPSPRTVLLSRTNSK